jgi:hypothetical protein
MLNLLWGTLTTLIIIFVVPIIIYGVLSPILKIKTPEGVSPIQFLLSVFITKIGTAFLIAALFYIMYIFFWLIMFILGEIGQVIGPNYSWKEAMAGIISELIYIPCSIYLVQFYF